MKENKQTDDQRAHVSSHLNVVLGREVFAGLSFEGKKEILRNGYGLCHLNAIRGGLKLLLHGAAKLLAESGLDMRRVFRVWVGCVSSLTPPTHSYGVHNRTPRPNRLTSKKP